MLFVIGGIALVAAPILLAIAASKRNRLGQMQATETYSAAQLEEVRDQMGRGSFIQRVEVKGKAECAEPLKAEFTGQACVAYNVRLDREYEETYWETDSEGRRSQKTRRGSETLSSNERRVPFMVRDQTGVVKVLPEGAEIVWETSLSKFETSLPGERFSLGSFAFDLTRAALGAGKRTLGYRYEEKLVPVGRDLYVLGEASDSGGELVVKRSSTKGEKFIVSVKSEEELSARAASGIKGLTAAAIIAAVAGIGLIVAGFFVG
jgi:hypothetical protein